MPSMSSLRLPHLNYWNGPLVLVLFPIGFLLFWFSSVREEEIRRLEGGVRWVLIDESIIHIHTHTYGDWLMDGTGYWLRSAEFGKRCTDDGSAISVCTLSRLHRPPLFVWGPQSCLLCAVLRCFPVDSRYRWFYFVISWKETFLFRLAVGFCFFSNADADGGGRMVFWLCSVTSWHETRLARLFPSTE